VNGAPTKSSFVAHVTSGLQPRNHFGATSFRRGGCLILDRRRRPRKPALLIWKPRPPSRGFLFEVLGASSGQGGGASLREGVLAVTVAECTETALILSSVAGLLPWAWWVPVLLGTIAALTPETSQGFLLTQQCGSVYLIRSITMTSLLCGVCDGCLCSFRSVRSPMCQSHARQHLCSVRTLPNTSVLASSR